MCVYGYHTKTLFSKHNLCLNMNMNEISFWGTKKYKFVQSLKDWKKIVDII